jgi:hypothetical protein
MTQTCGVSGAPTTQPAKPALTIGSFTVKHNPTKERWDVREDGKFRQDFATQDDAKQFVATELAKRPAKRGAKQRR